MRTADHFKASKGLQNSEDVDEFIEELEDDLLERVASNDSVEVEVNVGTRNFPNFTLSTETVPLDEDDHTVEEQGGEQIDFED